jgi:ABC-type antimicrobial peptide transport system permease subunit
MNGLATDLRHALRVYARASIASGLGILVLAIAIAVVSSFLTLYIDLAYTPDRAFVDSKELVSIGQNDGRTLDAMSLALIERINEEVGSLSGTVGFLNTDLDLGPTHEQRRVEFVSAGLFGDLHARLRLGRGFDDRDHRSDAEPVAVLSFRYWQARFGGSSDVIGRVLEITGRPALNLAPPGAQSTAATGDRTTEFRIIGVMSRELSSLQEQEAVAAWIPVELGVPLYFAPLDALRNFNMLRALSRRSPGATPEAIATELNQRYENADELGINPDEPFDAMSGLVFDINTQRNAQRQLQLFLAGSMLLVFVAAANVSLFMLSRAPERRRELAIRMSVGASLKRLGRQVATEAGLLVLSAASLGLLIAFWLESYLKSQPFLDGARWQSVTLFDWRVIGIILAFLLILALLVSLAPLLSLRRVGIASSSRQIGTRTNVTQRIACTTQIAIAGAVGAAAVAFGWYFGVLLTADHGYEVRDIHAVTFAQDQANEDVDALLLERERRREVIAAIPGFDAVAFGSALPGINARTLTPRVRRPVPPGDPVQFDAVSADRQYFEMLDIGLIGGRIYDEDEADVMLVNEAAARLIWGRLDVSGETLRVPFSNSERGSRIVGVVANVSHGHPEAEVPPRVYVPILRAPGEVILVRSGLSSADVRSRLQSAVNRGQLRIEIQGVQRLVCRLGELIAADRARGALSIVSSTIVLILAGFGFYGTLHYLVSANRREYAIRTSLGAGPKAIGRLVIGHGLSLGLPGVILGGLFAFIVATWLRGDYVPGTITPVFVTAIVLSGLVILLIAASMGPARQSKRMHAAPILRED